MSRTKLLDIPLIQIFQCKYKMIFFFLFFWIGSYVVLCVLSSFIFNSFPLVFTGTQHNKPNGDPLIGKTTAWALNESLYVHREAYLPPLTNSPKGASDGAVGWVEGWGGTRERDWVSKVGGGGEIKFMEMVDQRRTADYKLHNATKEGDDVCVRVLSNIHTLHFPT